MKFDSGSFQHWHGASVLIGWCRKMISDWIQEMTKSRGESLCGGWGGGGGGGLRCKFSFVKFLRIFVLRLQDRNINWSTLNDGFYFLTSCQDHGWIHPPPPPPKGISRAGRSWPDMICWLRNNNFSKTRGFVLTNFESIHILRLRKTRRTVGRTNTF